MTDSLFRLLMSIFLLLYIFFFIYLAKRYSENREHILFFIKKGKCCYGCKDEIETIISIFDKPENKYTLCTSCKRDEQLISLFEKNKFKRFFKNKFKFRKYIYEKEKLPSILLGISIFFLLIHITIYFLTDGKNSEFNYIYHFFSYILWVYNTIKLNLSYKKKALLN